MIKEKKNKKFYQEKEIQIREVGLFGKLTSAVVRSRWRGARLWNQVRLEVTPPLKPEYKVRINDEITPAAPNPMSFLWMRLILFFLFSDDIPTAVTKSELGSGMKWNKSRSLESDNENSPFHLFLPRHPTGIQLFFFHTIYFISRIHCCYVFYAFSDLRKSR